MPRIAIVGAGIAGLTAARCLRSRGTVPQIYESASTTARHTYPLTLQSKSFRPLLNFLGVLEYDFVSQVASRRLHGNGDGTISIPDANEGDGVFRAVSGRLERFLRGDLEVICGQGLKDIDVGRNDELKARVYGSSKRIPADIVIAGDGVHSAVRSMLLPTNKPEVLPYVVFNGKRRILMKDFRDKYLAGFSGRSSVEQLKGKTLLRASYSVDTEDDNDKSGAAGVVNLSYTFSRPARVWPAYDPLYAPDRSKSAASNVSEAFYAELQDLHPLQAPLGELLDVQTVRDDRKLHWLMRRVRLDESDTARTSGINVALIGDAAHACPILGGYGANLAIEDGLVLANLIIERGIEGVINFYSMRRRRWQHEYDKSEKRLELMHQPTLAVL